MSERLSPGLLSIATARVRGDQIGDGVAVEIGYGYGAGGIARREGDRVLEGGADRSRICFARHDHRGQAEPEGPRGASRSTASVLHG